MLQKRKREDKTNTTLIFYLRFFTSKTLTHIVQTGPLKNYLRQNKIWLFGARHVATVVFLVEVHPKYSRFTTLIGVLSDSAAVVCPLPDKKEHYLSRNPAIDPDSFQHSNPVSFFTLYTAKCSIQVEERRVTTEVINIRCATEDRTWLTHLLMLAASDDDETFKFIPQGTLPYVTYKTSLKPHIAYMDSICSIPIVGLSAAASSATVPLGDKSTPLDTYIIERTGARGLEPTNRTEDLGKHFHSGKYVSRKRT